jgi:hypothetical protein
MAAKIELALRIPSVKPNCVTCSYCLQRKVGEWILCDTYCSVRCLFRSVRTPFSMDLLSRVFAVTLEVIAELAEAGLDGPL